MSALGGGALMWPAILGMIFAILPEEKAGLAGGVRLDASLSLIGLVIAVLFIGGRLFSRRKPAQGPA
jgi:hypothetical protein